MLGVPMHAPAFLFERTTESEDGQVVEFVRSVYRGDRYRLVTECARRGDEHGDADVRARAAAGSPPRART